MTTRPDPGVRRALRSSVALTLLLAASTSAITARAQAAGPFFERIATLPVFRNLPEGSDPAGATAAEIVTATPDGTTLVYTDSPGERIGFVDIEDPAAPRPAGTLALEGEPTSVVVAGRHALVAVDTSESFTAPSGELVVVGMDDRAPSMRCDLGGQPDSVAVSPDGRFLAVAVENQRDEEVDDGAIPQAPPGHLVVLELEGDGRPLNCDAPRIVDLTGLAEVAPDDPEPEFVDINAANLAAVTLQENNHVVLVDLASGAVAGHFSAGSVDLEAIDASGDGVIAGEDSLAGVRREPDAIGWLDEERLVTANEGDYEGGSRGFTVFDRSGRVLFESGNALEHLAIRIGHFPEDRSDAKGIEPEGAEVARFGDETLIFVNAERGNFVAVYADRGPTAPPAFVQVLPTAVAPEGAIGIPSRDLFVVATEEDSEEDGIRATISLFARNAEAPAYPTLVSALDETVSAPIGWGALSALAADPSDPSRVYAVSDSVYAESRLYTIDVAAGPPTITSVLDVTKDSEAAAYDLEGIAVRPGGGFWLAAEGDPESDEAAQRRSLLLRVSAEGVVEREIALPDALYEQATARGFEGVAAWGEGNDERVILAIQSGWRDDPENTTRLAIYSPAADRWRFVLYPLEAPKSERGGWVGLSEITWLGEERFAVLERDNQPGVYAAMKAITVIDLAGVEPVAHGEPLPSVEKTTAIDLLPVLEESRGWITDKPEGFTVTTDGRLFLVTDNDGVDGASGETLFVEIGGRDRLR